ncbi:MAG: trypsin-like serine protease [Anaerolineales bacterium]|nr:trypsin-like serine protease [Anaerolineales bacterium]
MVRRFRILIAVLVIVNLGLIVVIAALLITNTDIFSSIFSFLGGSPAGMRVDVSVPSVVEVGEAFEMIVRVENARDEYLVVEEIRLPRNLLDAAIVTDVFPGTLDQHHEGSMTGFVIDFILAPHEVRDFRLDLRALEVVDFSGDIEVKAGSWRESSGTRLLIVVPTSPESVAEVTPTETMPPAAEIPFPSVVKITALYKENSRFMEGWTGSGSIITEDGLILTNAHVVLPDKFFPVDALIVSLTDQPDELPIDVYYAEVLQADWQLDIAVLRITTDLDEIPVELSQLHLPAVPLGDSDQIQLGDSLLILGYPGIGGETITLTRGEVSGFTSEVRFGDRAFIKTSGTIAGGNSGGLVADEFGRLVAIPTQLGYGGEDQFVDCRVIVDTNRDGVVDENDNCVPTGGFINALRPIKLALPMIEAAKRGEYSIIEQPKPDVPLPEGRVALYQEDFSDTDSGWAHDTDPGGFVGYKNNEYVIEVDVEKYLYWGVPRETFSDIVLQVSTRVITPVEGGEFGVICRYQDNENFYGMSVTSDGWFAIWKLENDEIVMLLDWDYSRDIPIYEPMTITAACSSNELTLAVNEKVLGQVKDFTYTKGDIGLFAGTWEEGGLAVAFDDLKVLSP